MKINFVAYSLYILLLVAITACNGNENKEKIMHSSQKKLGHRSVNIIEQDSLQFKDLNKNDTLDIYEDWRRPINERARDLLSKMTVEEKIGMMLIADMRMGNEPNMVSALGKKSDEQQKPITSDFNEEDIISELNQFTGEKLQYPVMNAVGTTKGITKHHIRHYILRTNAPADTLAKWTNRVQELAEKDRLGIPVIFASNPRNHLNGATLGTTQVVSNVFSQWPTELGLAAMNDPQTVRKFADIARQEWLAVGIRKGYMYMADIATEPRWQRVEGTFGEHSGDAAVTIKEIVLGFQGEELGDSSVALTTKHFPGGASTEKGHDPHYSFGRNEVFPGGMFENNLIPFKAAIAAGTSSIMPYYSLPKNTPYEEVAYAYNKEILQDLLRDTLGFKGIINSDTGPIDAMPRGVEDLTIEERYAKALEAGINLFAGNADPALLLKTVQDSSYYMQYVDASVLLLLKELFQLGLFENPYVDETQAALVAGKEAFQKEGDIAQRKSIVLLRNPNKTLHLKEKTKIYFEIYAKPYGQPITEKGEVFSDSAYDHFEFTQTPEEADMILLWLKPAMRPLFPADSTPLRLSLSQCAVDVAYVNQLAAKKPTILAVNISNPFVLSEVYNNETKKHFPAILATFGNTPQALLDVVSGKFNPSGKLPVTLPISEEAVEKSKEDVPGYMEHKDYALFKFGEGMSY